MTGKSTPDIWASLCSVFYVCAFCPRWGSDGSQSRAYLDHSFSFSIPDSNNLLLWQNFNLSYEQLVTWLWRLTSRWHDAWSPPECFNEIAVQAYASSWRFLEGHQNDTSCSGWCQDGQMHCRKITVVGNKFVVMIIKFGSCLCSSSIAKLLLLVIQISYLANLV